MSTEYRIRNGSVMVGSHLVEADLIVSGEKIAALVARDSSPSSASDVDATGRVVLPGIIDLHCHSRDPGYTYKEDFLTASSAGAVGGVTTMVDMPNVEPPTDTVDEFLEKRARADEMSIVDWGHWVAGVREDQIGPLAEAGATGYKIFQVSGAYPHDPRIAVNDEDKMLRLFQKIAATGLPVLVHPFNQRIFDELSAQAFANGEPPNWRTFSKVYVEEAVWDTAAKTLLQLQRLSGVNLHLLHTHSAGSLELIRMAKAKGQSVTCEIDTKYYHVTLEELERLQGRVCPGGYVTDDAERMAAIWRSLNDGTIDHISSDHAPHTLEEVGHTDVDAWDAHMGSPQYDWQYSMTLTDVAEGKLSLAKAVQLFSENPARILGVWPRKGVIHPGADADLLIVDLERKTTLTDDGMQTKVQWNPYIGRTVQGYVESTFVRGKLVAQDRQVMVEPGHGNYVHGTARRGVKSLV